MFMVSPATARKWAARYRPRARPGWPTGQPRPHRSPTKTPPRSCARSCGCGGASRLGPVQIAGRLGMPASTVHAVLVRCRINRLSRIDRVTGEPIRRYEHDHPGSLIHVDVTKFGNIPDGGGWRYVGRQQGDRNKRAPRSAPGHAQHATRSIGTAFLHTVIDDHSRVAYVEICSDEKAATAVGVLQRAVAWFADRGVTVERVLSDNGSATGPTPGATPAPSSASPTNDPALPAPDQRQDRTIPPHPGRRLGLRPALRLRDPPPSRPTRLAALLQSPPAHSAIGGTTHQQAQQPAWTSHLGLVRARIGPTASRCAGTADGVPMQARPMTPSTTK